MLSGARHSQKSVCSAEAQEMYPAQYPLPLLGCMYAERQAEGAYHSTARTRLRILPAARFITTLFEVIMM